MITLIDVVVLLLAYAGLSLGCAVLTKLVSRAASARQLRDCDDQKPVSRQERTTREVVSWLTLLSKLGLLSSALWLLTIAPSAMGGRQPALSATEEPAMHRRKWILAACVVATAKF